MESHEGIKTSDIGRFRRQLTLLWIAIAVLGPALSGMVALLAVTASQGTGQVIAGPDGPVEFLGLQSWDAQELFDAIQEIDPDRPFHACAVVMKQQLGFADAAAILYSTHRSSDRYTIMVGVEDSTRVQYRPIGIERVVLPETWQNLKAAVGEDVRTLTAAARTLHSRGGFFNSVFNSARRRAERMGADPETLDQVWDLIDRADDEEDHRLAHEVLAKDTSRSARVVATLLLGNFMDDDTSWHGLVGSLVDPDPASQNGGQQHARGADLHAKERPRRLVCGARASVGALRRHESVRVQDGPESPGRYGR